MGATEEIRKRRASFARTSRALINWCAHSTKENPDLRPALGSRALYARNPKKRLHRQSP